MTINRNRRKAVLLQQGGKCANCDELVIDRNWRGYGKTLPPNAATLDHIIPKFLGGSNSRENLQVLCMKCHTEKSAGESGLGYMKSRERRSEHEIGYFTNNIHSILASLNGAKIKVFQRSRVRVRCQKPSCGRFVKETKIYYHSKRKYFICQRCWRRVNRPRNVPKLSVQKIWSGLLTMPLSSDATE